jgi:hypothetical protein
VNLVEKEQIIDLLERASDYARGVLRLDDKGKAIVQKLREWADDLATITGQSILPSFHYQLHAAQFKSMTATTILDYFCYT